MAARHVGLLFRRELLDMRRERRVLRRLFLQPFVFVLVIATPAYLVQRHESRERSRILDVAVQGDIDAIPGLRAALDRAPFRVDERADAAARLAAESAAIGVVVPPSAAADVAAGRTVALEILTFSTQDVAERAAAAMVRRLADLRREQSALVLTARGASEELADPIRIELDDVATTSTEGIRFGLAQALPALLVIQLFGLVSVAQERLAGAKDKRTLESLLVLPIRRRELLTGIGGASIIVGAVSSVIIFVPTTIGITSAVASISRSLAGPAALAVALFSGAIGLSIVFTALGLLLGARASTGGEGSVFVTLVQVTIFGVILASPFLAEVAADGPIVALPVLGPMIFVREGVASGPTLTATATMFAGQLLVAALCARYAVRLLDDERNVVRAS